MAWSTSKMRARAMHSPFLHFIYTDRYTNALTARSSSLRCTDRYTLISQTTRRNSMGSNKKVADKELFLKHSKLFLDKVLKRNSVRFATPLLAALSSLVAGF